VLGVTTGVAMFVQGQHKDKELLELCEKNANLELEKYMKGMRGPYN
jgi:hypothetical protein